MERYGVHSVVDGRDVSVSLDKFTADDALKLITRIQSLEEIVASQDEELKQVLGGEESELLNKWREKVFSLMLQDKLWNLRFNTEVPALHAQIDTLRSDLQKREQQKKDVEKLLIEEHTQLTKMKRELNSHASQASLSHKSNIDTIAFIDKLGSLSGDFEHKCLSLLSHLNERVQNAQQGIETAEASYVSLLSQNHRELATERERCTALSADMKTLNREKSELQAHKDSLTRERDGLRLALDGAKKEMDREIKEKESEINTIRRQMDLEKEESLAAILSLQQQSDLLRTQLNERVKELETYREEAKEKDREIDYLSHKATQADTSLTRERESCDKEISLLRAEAQREIESVRKETTDKEEKRGKDYTQREEKWKKELFELKYALTKAGTALKSANEKHKEALSLLKQETTEKLKEMREREIEALERVKAVTQERDELKYQISELQRMLHTKSQRALSAFHSGDRDSKHYGPGPRRPSLSSHPTSLSSFSLPPYPGAQGHDDSSAFPSFSLPPSLPAPRARSYSTSSSASFSSAVFAQLPEGDIETQYPDRAGLRGSTAPSGTSKLSELLDLSLELLQNEEDSD